MVRDTKPRLPDPPHVEDRRAFDGILSERVARMEGRLQNAEEGIGRVESGLTRVHARVDDVLKMLEGIGSNIRSSVDACIEDHERDEAVILDARFGAMNSKFDALENKMDFIAEQGKLRGDESNKHLEDLRRMGLSVILTMGSLIAGIGGWVIAFLIDKGPHIIALIEKLDQIK